MTDNDVLLVEFDMTTVFGEKAERYRPTPEVRCSVDHGHHVLFSHTDGRTLMVPWPRVRGITWGRQKVSDGGMVPGENPGQGSVAVPHETPPTDVVEAAETPRKRGTRKEKQA